MEILAVLAEVCYPLGPQPPPLEDSPRFHHHHQIWLDHIMFCSIGLSTIHRLLVTTWYKNEFISTLKKMLLIISICHLRTKLGNTLLCALIYLFNKFFKWLSNWISCTICGTSKYFDARNKVSHCIELWSSPPITFIRNYFV